MRLLEERILKDGKLGEGNVLKVDSFLNHQIDVAFLSELGKEFKKIFSDCEITKILTIESSGIAIACLTAQFFNVPVVFAKKTKTINIYGDAYISKVESFTHKTIYDIFVSKNFLNPKDKILIIDDFLAKGNALTGLVDLATLAGATVVGAGIVIEKAFQNGGKSLRENGFRIESLAKIKSMDMEKGILFYD